MTTVDLAIIGGGINGCGIAREAAGRGYSVLLCEQDDLASATSSASTKLVHGGLRYLEHYDFRLVREALREREILWRMAPHVVRPLRFVLPHHAGLRPAWLLRLGLFLYDHLGGREALPATRTVHLRRDPAGAPLKPAYTLGFEYSDCWVDDARLVVLVAQDAAGHGASIRTRTRCTGARRQGDEWIVALEGRRGAPEEIRARALVNAAGPWVARVLEEVVHAKPAVPVRLVQGSHIVVRRLYEHAGSYVFQNADGRIVFAIPFEHDFTLIGTTDRDFTGDPATARAGEEEIAYLCAAASDYFVRPVARADVVWTYSGVRPLYDERGAAAKDVTRDYLLTLDSSGAPLLSVFGGKITTFRRLAEAAVSRLALHLPPARNPRWASDRPLPGGDFPATGAASLSAELQRRCGGLSPLQAERLARAYGTRALGFVDGLQSPAGAGRRFGDELGEREAAYLMDREWAMTAADVVWRRSKLGLRMTAGQIGELDAWMKARRPAETPASAGS